VTTSESGFWLTFALSAYGTISATAFALFAALCLARVELFKEPHPWARALAFSLLCGACWPFVLVALLVQELQMRRGP
jgi:hypothetical protein